MKDLFQATAHPSFQNSLWSLSVSCAVVQLCVEFPSLGSEGANEAAVDPSVLSWCTVVPHSQIYSKDAWEPSLTTLTIGVTSPEL